MFKTLLKYKTEYAGKSVIEIERFFPSSNDGVGSPMRQY